MYFLFYVLSDLKKIEQNTKSLFTVNLKVTFKTDIPLAKEDLKIYSGPVGLSKSLI